MPLVVGGAVVQFLLGYLMDLHFVDAETARIIWFLIGVVVWWPTTAVGVKRRHDLNRSGWWVLVGGVPYLGPVIVLVANGLSPGTAGDNRFGKDPTSQPYQSSEAFNDRA